MVMKTQKKNYLSNIIVFHYLASWNIMYVVQINILRQEFAVISVIIYYDIAGKNYISWVYNFWNKAHD